MTTATTDKTSLTSAQEELREVLGEPSDDEARVDPLFGGEPEPVKEEETKTDDTPTDDRVDDAVGDDDSADREDVESDSQTSADDDSRDETEASGEEFSPELLARAQQLGMAEDIAKRLGTPEDLITVISRIEGSVGVAPKEEVRPPDAEVGEKAEQAKPAAKVEKFELKIDTDELDEGVVKQLNLMNDHYAAQNDRQTARLEAMQASLDDGAQSQANAQGNQIAQAYDPHFARLGREDLFGNGSTLAMDAKSPQFEARVKLMMFGQRHIANLKQFGGGVPAEDVLFDGLFESLYPGQRERKTADKIGKTIRERRSTVVPSPSGASSETASKLGKVETRLQELKAEGRL